LNHEDLISQLSKALAQIAAVLPRANMKLLLYPTDQIKLGMSKLYANIIKFIQRAINWYDGGKVKHAITAMFRPAPLRFEDLVNEISACSQTIDELALSASQAELRDVHLLLLEVRRIMAGNIHQMILDIEVS
jgi:hypothetical protein